MIAQVWPAGLEQPLSEEHYGAKAARLSAALRAGLPVPPGFAVPVETLDRLAMGDLEVAEQAALLDLARGFAGVPVAVRSSAVGEDGAGASFAGQHVSFLNVVGAADIVEALAEVWRSGHSSAVRAYRARLGVAGEPRVGALVQRLVPADVAGVLFTADPLSGRRDRWIVEATWGLGEAVVSGLVTPDSYVLAPDGSVLQSRAGRKDLLVVPADGGGTAEAEIEDQRRVHALCLDAQQLGRIAALGARVEELFGPAQDVEWALASGALYLLQARPVTTRKA